MKLELRPQLRQMLAPQLIQSLKMLQMPALKLEQTIRHELATNPLLEEIEELQADEQSDVDGESEFDVADDKADKDDSVDWDQFFSDEDEGYKVSQPREQTDDRFEGPAALETTLFTHLSDQLAMLKLTEDEHLIAEYVIGNIAPDGYLVISVPEMAAELKMDEADIETVLVMVQRFDPVGVGARDLRESLLIQLRERDLEASLAWRIVDEHINDLDRKSILQVARMMGVPEERAQSALEVVKSLSPTPAHGRFDSGAMPVVPDLIVERLDDQFMVLHNDDYVPRLRVNASYRNLIRRGNETPKDTKQYIRQKLEQARWLINSIQQSRSTMIRVMEAIIEKQHDFFERGPAFLKPLIMEDIAQMVEMNVATISRVSSGKYVQTSFGVREIKYFFNPGISKDNGEDMSKRSVKQRIEEIIKSEPIDKPFSDQEIFRRLNEEGIRLARRTVTKYREELKIPSARLRKRVVSSDQ